MIKVDIISGFLGAGKTTYIKKMIGEVYQGERIVLIENEFGEVGIDGSFLHDTGVDIVEINSGCICCTLVGDFEKNLKNICHDFNPDRIIIEPSGVGKLSDVIQSIKRITSLEIEHKIVVVNALKVEQQIRAFGEFFSNQVQFAKTIVFSRSQNASEKQLLSATKMLGKINRNATYITTPWEQLSGVQIKEALQQNKQFIPFIRKTSCSCGDQGEHQHSCHDALEVFQSWGVETVKRYTEVEISNMLNKLSLNEVYGEILRAKGIVQSKEESWIQFDMVCEEQEIRPSKGDYTGRICVIGRNLQEQELNKLFGI